MYLYNCELNKKYMVTEVLTTDGIARRLEALGMNENTTISVVARKQNGPIIVKVRGTRLALGKKIASKIQVKED
ncbi:MAG: ferrous iron transport protein A, partial [Clostridiales bacterium]|nr:ferrous iron transport protein A [Clostridiales bacterium]